MTDVLSLTTDPLDPGAVIAGRYEVIRPIATGGMASVYVVRDSNSSGDLFALKVLHREFSQDKKYIERFVREVRLMHQVDHPNVVKTFDIGVDNGSFYFTMEYIDGETLERRMAERSFTPTEIADLTVEIAKGLSAIHERHIVHRDLKPGNVLINSDGGVKITDFGVAREEGSRLTQKHQKVGSLCYIAPELWLGRGPTPAADFYSLGMVLYELCTGSLPFEHTFPGKIMQMHVDEDVVPPVERDRSVPSWLNKLVLRLLEKSPRKRPRTAQDIIEYVLPYTWGATGGGSPSRIQPAIVEAPSGTTTVFGREPKKRKTYILQLHATRLLDDSRTNSIYPRRPSKVISIPLPHRAALVFEVPPPSRDFLYLGIFLASLQICDGLLTSMGMARWGTEAEANFVLRALMHHVGPDTALLIMKGAAISVVLTLTVLARSMRWIKDLIAALSCLYLVAAILPWLFLLTSTGRIQP